MSMEVVFEIAEENLKVFVAALHCLSQIGKELSVESDAQGQLTCRALNDAHSASGQIAFDRSFFAEARLVDEQSHASGNGGHAHTRRSGALPFVRCKVFAKSCANIFRTLKHVRSLQIGFLVHALDSQSRQEDDDGDADDELDVDCDEIRWRLRCDFDITKTHRMKVHAGQIMRAVFDRRACPSHLVARHFHLASLLAHIHHSNEVAVTCAETQVKFESYFPSTGDGKAHLHTETAVDSAEFQEYTLAPSSVGIDASVQLIFCLKEVRALLAFCKTSDIAEVQFYFSSSGSPVLLSAESTALSKVAIEITLSTVTTFLPAASQTRSEEEMPLSNREATQENPGLDVALLESDSSQQQQPRYLSHTKRMRID